jgi:hypothetical protein
VPKRPRRKKTVPRIDIQQVYMKGGYITGWSRKGIGYNEWGTTPIDEKEDKKGRRGVQKEKYIMEYPIITMTKDDVEFIAD